jgi:hypothetical protein
VYLEVGSGNSTKIVRQTIRDLGLSTQVWSVDPEPRAEIDHLADRVIRARVETLDPEMFAELGDGDILFIDSSHRVSVGNDVAYLFLTVLPALRRGVLVHVHDIFLPFDYPAEWVIDARWDWNEQYLVQAILGFSDAFEVLWAGHHLQHTLDGFAGHFEHLGDRRAQSLWLRKAR